MALAGALVIVANSLPALAQQTFFELDPAATQVEFTLPTVLLRNVHGSFKVKRGEVKFDPASGKASGLIVIDATSGQSGNRARDRKMHRDVLESARYPVITFAPQHIQGQVLSEGSFQVQVSGTLTMHGVGHPLTLAVSALAAGDKLAADAHFSIPYVDWGLKNPSTFFLRVSDTVDISIHAVGRIKPNPLAWCPTCTLTTACCRRPPHPLGKRCRG